MAWRGLSLASLGEPVASPIEDWRAPHKGKISFPSLVLTSFAVTPFSSFEDHTLKGNPLVPLNNLFARLDLRTRRPEASGLPIKKKLRFFSLVFPTVTVTLFPYDDENNP